MGRRTRSLGRPVFEGGKEERPRGAGARARRRRGGGGGADTNPAPPAETPSARPSLPLPVSERRLSGRGRPAPGGARKKPSENVRGKRNLAGDCSSAEKGGRQGGRGVEGPDPLPRAPRRDELSPGRMAVELKSSGSAEISQKSRVQAWFE